MVRYTFIFVLLISALLVVLTVPGQTLPIPLAAARLVLGMALALFCPGYALQAALFPRRNTVDGAERLALSVGISLALVPLIALVLDPLPWGIRLETVLAVEVGVTLLATVLAWVRRRSLPPEDRWEWAVSPAGIAHRFGSRLPSWLYTGLVGVLALDLLLLLMVIRLAGRGEPVTEFYLSGPEGPAFGYPYRGVVGEPLTVTVGIVNGEGTIAEYRLEVVDGDHLLGQAGPVRLEPGAVYEGPLSFIPARAGDPVRVSFLLYRSGLPIPYRTLWLWLRVEE